MPNIVAHAHITKEVFPEASPDLLLGSTLPDFIGMNRDYLHGSLRVGDAKQIPELSQGVALHLKTDTIFDDLFLRKDLLTEGQQDCLEHVPELNPKAAHRLADIGTDILLDVAVLETKQGYRVYQELKTAVLAGRTALAATGDTNLEELVKRYFAEDRAFRYSDTAWLTQMLRHRSSLRTRHILNFEDHLLLPVSEMFDRHLGRIRQAAGGLLALTVTGLIESEQ